MSKNAEAAQSPRVQYDVRYVPGGIDRVILTKRDDSRNLCIQVTLVSPTPLDRGATARELQLPPDWSLDRAIAVRDAGACRGTMRRSAAGAIAASEVTGSVRWRSSPTDGTAVDLRLSFPAQSAEPAFSERISFTR